MIARNQLITQGQAISSKRRLNHQKGRVEHVAIRRQVVGVAARGLKPLTPPFWRGFMEQDRLHEVFGFGEAVGHGRAAYREHVTGTKALAGPTGTQRLAEMEC
tara:strand:+ start:8084 stop:8392 length:309 start_codon:yes stop_codon:yes gene_type:complete